MNTLTSKIEDINQAIAFLSHRKTVFLSIFGIFIYLLAFVLVIYCLAHMYPLVRVKTLVHLNQLPDKRWVLESKMPIPQQTNIDKIMVSIRETENFTFKVINAKSPTTFVLEEKEIDHHQMSPIDQNIWISSELAYRPKTTSLLKALFLRSTLQ